MRKKWRVAAVVFLSMLVSGCSKEVPGVQKINDILREEGYIKMMLAESYHQEEVLFDLENDRAVVPEGIGWGLQKYRDGAETGANYGEEESVDIYESDKETNPELYIESYLDSVRELNLTVQDVRDSGYAVRVVKNEHLSVFEEELAILSSVVVDDAYRLVGVEIKFDKKFRPIEKIFQLEKKDSTNLENEEKDSGECTQKFSYDIGKMRFGWAFDHVKKSIEDVY